MGRMLLGRNIRFFVTRALVAALAVAALAGDARATARPAKDEESELVPPGEVRCSAGLEDAGNRDDVGARALTMAVTIGLSPSTDLTVDGAFLRLDLPALGHPSGWGDPTVVTRTRIFDERGERPSLEYSLGVKLPSGDHTRDLGTEETDFFSYLHAAHKVRGVRLHANVGFTIVGLVSRWHQQEDSFLYGLAMDAPLGSRVTLLTDIFEEQLVNTRRNPFSFFEDYGHGLIVGMRVGAAHVTWDAAVFHPLDGGQDLWGVTAGATFPLRFRRNG